FKQFDHVLLHRSRAKRDQSIVDLARRWPLAAELVDALALRQTLLCRVTWVGCRGSCNKHKRWIFIASRDAWRGRYLRIGFFSFVSPTKKSKTWQAIARPCGLSLLAIDQWPGYCRCKSAPHAA